MPLSKYGVLVGKAVAARREDSDDTPHYQVQIRASGTNYRIAVNVKSNEQPSELLYLIKEDFSHPILARLADLREGFALLPSQPGGMALDFIRGNLFDRSEMRLLPHNVPGPDNDLSDRIEHYVKRAINEPGALVFAFGQRWGPEQGQRDKIFGFQPGNGIHDIHMNQGNVAAYRNDDGVWQDGGLILRFPSSNRWVALFLGFQSQAWHTDDVTGHAIELVEQPDKTVRIMAAMVNPVGGGQEVETVILLNPTPRAIDLAGWRIADQQKRKCPLAGNLPAGGVLTATLAAPTQLGNSGGIITLLNADGLKVDGVSYTKEQAQREGWLVVF
ncbi:MAG: DUF2278 family protein [Burkholderiales bacterium]